MKYLAIGTGIAAVAIIVAFFIIRVQPAKAPGMAACATDTQICLDGSTVSRSGPDCAFVCPVVDDSLFTGTTTLQMALGKGGTGLGITLTPLAVLEDSRCPVGTQCIQAGTVRLSTRLVSSAGETLQTFTLGKPVQTALDTITLTAVSPDKKAGEQPSGYLFTFTVAKNAEAPLYTSSISGTVTLGPTCAVAKNPPDPKCLDKRYSTLVAAYRNGSTDAYATTTSKADGTFTLVLPPGAYTVTANPGKTPRCTSVDATLKLNTNVSLVVLTCDTGIR